MVYLLIKSLAKPGCHLFIISIGNFLLWVNNNGAL